LAGALTRNEPSQHAQVLRLQGLAEARSDVDRDILRSADRDAAAAIIRANAGRGSTAEVRGLVDALVGQEIALLEARDRASFVQARRVRLMIWAGAAIDIALLLGVGRLIAAYAGARRAAAQALEEANAVLETRVRERTAELAAANRRLTEDNFERKWANLALQHQLHYNELIVNSIADLVIVVTKALNVSRINPAVARLVGREPTEIVNQPLSGLVAMDGGPAGGGPEPLGPLSLALAEGHEIRDTPVRIGDRGGRPVPALLSLYPVRDQDKVVGGVVILRVAP
jgi:PAS domain-containing protein